MKKRRTQILQKVLAVFLLIMMTGAAGAQKLPNVQTVSVSAPQDIKIDGNAAEWGNKFSAYNNATEVFYTISNNTANLYLIVQSADDAIIQKIVAGGITFSIKSTNKKSIAVPVAITYPIVPDAYSPGVSYKLRTNKTLSDADLIALNKQVSDHIKVIRVTGVKEIPDSAVSVYNDLGIQAAGLIDHKKAYTYELSIPIKYLKQVIDDTGAFRYIIQVNGLDIKSTNVVVGTSTNTDPQQVSIDHGSNLFLVSPTYLSGTYTLAKGN